MADQTVKILLPVDRPRRSGSVPRMRRVTREPANIYDATLARAAFDALLYRYTDVGGAHTTLADLLKRDTLPSYDTVAFGGPASELWLEVSDAAITACFDANLFDDITVERMLGHYERLLQATSVDTQIEKLALLTEAEADLMLVSWNDTATSLPAEGCLHQAFEARAAAQPEAVAAVHGVMRLSYGEVNAEANRLARHLVAQGVRPGDRVGMALDRTPALLVTMLAVLKAGGAYVPIDPGYPRRRIASMIAGADCAGLVSRSDLAIGLGDAATPVLLDRVDLTGHSTENLDIPTTPDDLCYIIFTSGSTGEPKPIALRHRGVLNNIVDLNTRFGVGPGDSVLNLSSPSFDMSVYENLGLTAAGGTVVYPEHAKDPAHWAQLLRMHAITVWNSAPALMDLVVEALAGARLPALRLALLGGDWIPVSLPARARAVAPGLRFIAMGGATEASIHSTLFEVTDVDPTWSSIPYGKPMANQRTYIVDEAGQPTPIGVPGDLHLAGIGLAVGYLNQPERTAERFTTWSYGPVTGERVYRTGDLARYRADGQIELLGRLDFQVKINGLRVELGEVEAALRSHETVRDAAVAAHTDAAGDRQLVGYVTTGSAAPEAEVLRTHVARALPSFMVPAVVMVVDALPLSANGKLDRKALPAPPAIAVEAAAVQWYDQIEARIAAVWQELLGVEHVRRDSDFFALGGDSMKALRGMARIDSRLRWVDMYRNPTLAGLAEHLRSLPDQQ